jgi:hypothetical protein
MIGALLLVPMLALGASFRADTRTVTVQPVEGLRADSLQRAEFLDAFRSTLAQSAFNTQERVHGEWVGGTAFANQFAPVFDADDGEGWSLRVIVELPPIASFTRQEMSGGKPHAVKKSDPRRRSSRRFAVTALASSAIDGANDAAPEWAETGLVFPAPEAAPAGSWYTPSLRGYDFPWAEAGRVAALVAIEALHRADGDLRDNTRLDLAPALRAEAAH